MDRHPFPNRPNTLSRRLATGNLKLCPLCGAINSRQNGECFVCRWSGEFDHDPVHIELGVHELIERCPELLDALYGSPPFKIPVRTRIGLWLQRVFGRRRPLDLSA